MRQTRLHRLGLVLTAVFQLLLPTFASVADARAEAAAERGAIAHVEEHSSPGCVPVHAADCLLCRVIAGGATTGHAPVAPTPPVRHISGDLPRYASSAPVTAAHRDPSQRAPPTA